MATEIPDPRGIPQTLGGVTYASPLSYDGVHPDEYRAIASIPCFQRTAIQADAENDLERLALYAWDGQLYWGIEVEALCFRVWRELFAVYDIDLAYDGSFQQKRRRHVAEVANRMVAVTSGPLVEQDFDVDIWRYWVYGERPYVANLFSQPDQLFEYW